MAKLSKGSSSITASSMFPEGHKRNEAYKQIENPEELKFLSENGRLVGFTKAPLELGEMLGVDFQAVTEGEAKRMKEGTFCKMGCSECEGYEMHMKVDGSWVCQNCNNNEIEDTEDLAECESCTKDYAHKDSTAVQDKTLFCSKECEEDYSNARD